MKRRPSFALRAAATLLPLSVLGATLAPVGAGAGTVGCNTVCKGTLMGCPVVTPQTPGLTVRPGATSALCSLASETLTISNATPYKVTLTSAFFVEPGKMLIEAGMVINTIIIDANSSTEVLATPQAVTATSAALSGTIAGAPIEITVSLAPDGGSLRCVVEADGAVATEEAGSDSGALLLTDDAGHDAGKKGTPDVSASHDTGARRTPDAGNSTTVDSALGG
jgi:hypothetical protein